MYTYGNSTWDPPFLAEVWTLDLGFGGSHGPGPPCSGCPMQTGNADLCKCCGRIRRLGHSVHLQDTRLYSQACVFISSSKTIKVSSMMSVNKQMKITKIKNKSYLRLLVVVVKPVQTRF